MPESTRPGRKRDGTRDVAILQATLAVLGETGYERMTTDVVAARAGVSKATMYRRWPSKAQLVVEAVESLREEPPAVPDDTGDLVGDLISLLDENSARSAKFNIFAGLVPVLSHDADLAAAVHRRIMRPRATAVRVAIEREQTRGGISADRDPDMLAAAVVAMITYRLLITGEPVDEAFMTSVVQNVLRDSSSPQSD
ncbi:TetR/AcrR family transcriptional regulator [Mycolicibacterium goodii]|uniref:TetR/AcrR family transcriptional regulator n=1 Tax=Mycolicibacterium goodii TaxID=134601 RepID=UPI001BDD191F|nr:TetR/AcrR family transcriptional regulator [Mycolicibacterium goodii]MBU8833536.1 TetR/AcrR family transcriptional regulator [Mycolicibacterium goodii]